MIGYQPAVHGLQLNPTAIVINESSIARWPEYSDLISYSCFNSVFPSLGLPCDCETDVDRAFPSIPVPPKKLVLLNTVIKVFLLLQNYLNPDVADFCSTLYFEICLFS